MIQSEQLEWEEIGGKSRNIGKRRFFLNSTTLVSGTFFNILHLGAEDFFAMIWEIYCQMNYMCSTFVPVSVFVRREYSIFV